MLTLNKFLNMGKSRGRWRGPGSDITCRKTSLPVKKDKLVGQREMFPRPKISFSLETMSLNEFSLERERQKTQST